MAGVPAAPIQGCGRVSPANSGKPQPGRVDDQPAGGVEKVEERPGMRTARPTSTRDGPGVRRNSLRAGRQGCFTVGFALVRTWREPSGPPRRSRRRGPRGYGSTRRMRPRSGRRARRSRQAPSRGRARPRCGRGRGHGRSPGLVVDGRGRATRGGRGGVPRAARPKPVAHSQRTRGGSWRTFPAAPTLTCGRVSPATPRPRRAGGTGMRTAAPRMRGGPSSRGTAGGRAPGRGGWRRRADGPAWRCAWRGAGGQL